MSTLEVVSDETPKAEAKQLASTLDELDALKFQNLTLRLSIIERERLDLLTGFIAKYELSAEKDRIESATGRIVRG